MAILLGDLIPQLRREIDPEVLQEESLVVDGTQYRFNLDHRPVVAGSDSVSINHTVNTSGVFQTVPSGITGLADGFHYTPDLNRAQMTLLSGTFPNGVPFTPWDGTEVTFQYSSTQFTDSVLAGYLADAVPKVEAHMNLGYQLIDVAPSGAGINDQVGYYGIGVSPNTIGIMPEPLNISQSLMIKEAALLVANRERTLGVRGDKGISIRDGDIEINASNTFRAAESSIKDRKEELKFLYQEIKLNMDAGIGIIQLNEQWMNQHGTGDYTDPDYFRDYANDPRNPYI